MHKHYCLKVCGQLDFFKIFFFWKSCAQQGCINQKYSKTVIIWNIITT